MLYCNALCAAYHKMYCSLCPLPTSLIFVYKAFLLLITTEHCSFQCCFYLTRPDSQSEQLPLTSASHLGMAALIRQLTSVQDSVFSLRGHKAFYLNKSVLCKNDLFVAVHASFYHVKAAVSYVEISFVSNTASGQELCSPHNNR